MNVLLIYPGFPDTYWSFRYALSFQGKRAAQPPLGLMTVAALLPPEWNKRLVDTNVERLRDRDLAWADVAFIGGMHVQQARPPRHRPPLPRSRTPHRRRRPHHQQRPRPRA